MLKTAGSYYITKWPKLTFKSAFKTRDTTPLIAINQYPAHNMSKKLFLVRRPCHLTPWIQHTDIAVTQMTASRSTSSAFLYINNGLIALLIKLNTYSTKYYCSLTVTIAVYTAQMFSARFLETRQYSGGALKHTENNSQICWSKVE